MGIRSTRNGFTLLELSIVILVLSLMLGGIMTIINQNVRLNKQAELKEKLDTIQVALLTYRRAYERLPCPGGLTYKVGTANFGLEGAQPIDCGDDTPGSDFESGNVHAGSVPVKTLGLPYTYAFDPWGNRFMYAVDNRVTDITANVPFRSYLPHKTTIGAITIQDNEGDSITTKAIYAIISFGPNGHGAYGLSGVRKANNSSNTYELENCDCNAAGVSTGFDTVFALLNDTVSTTALNQYDDTVVYALRKDLLSSDEELNGTP